MAAVRGSGSRRQLPRLLLLLQATAVAMGGMANALTAFTSASSMEKAQGETVVLDCTWTVDPTDTGVLDVEWFLQAPTTNIYVATFAGGKENIYPDFASRVRFARNVTQRDASLQIAGLRASDDGAYTCKVKVGMLIKQVPIKLTVLVKPSQPSCVVNGSLQLGKDLSLQCLSTEGTSPISYQWRKTSGEGTLPPVVGGTLPIKNASVSHSGMYQCNATNRVGWQSCVVLLSVVPPSSNAGVVAGSVIGVLLVVAVVGFLVWFLLRQRKGKPVQDRDYHNDIRMDDSPPASMSRPPTRAAHDLPSTRTSIGSATPSNGLLALRSAPPGPSGPGGPPYERADGRGRAGAFPSVREESEISGGGGGGGPAYESVAHDDDDYDSEDDLPPSHSPEPPKPKSAVIYSELEVRPGGGGGGGVVHGTPSNTEYASVRRFPDNSAV
ncbi:coxsackievirus and adenovirus receptor-like isoform X2 [Petromyzon marinus]|uniref:coxsackievirus and adenovirus receptor-like isoform X2 n=1 Tax=Petromyzon marinus TaxID=7757 RepID=UPI003F719CC8